MTHFLLALRLKSNEISSIVAHIHKTLLALTIIICLNPAYSQTPKHSLDWAKQFTHASSSNSGESIVVDDSGNVYTLGSFIGTMNYITGTGVQSLNSAGNSDIFVLKLDSTGTFLWAKAFGDVGNDNGVDICLDHQGNIIMTGGFEGSVDFDPGPGTNILNSEGDVDIFIVKLNSNGNLIWATRTGGPKRDSYCKVIADSLGNIYSTGEFRGTVDFDPGSGWIPRASNGGSEVFIQKHDKNGNIIWAKKFGGSASDYGRAIEISTDGDIIVGGIFHNNAELYPGNAQLSSNGGTDIFLLKLEPNGDLVWIKQMGGTEQDLIWDIDIDDNGNINCVGTYRGSVDFDPGSGSHILSCAGIEETFVQKLDRNGNFSWVTSTASSIHAEGKGVSSDRLGNVYVIGYFSDTVDFNYGPGNFTLVSRGSENIFVEKLTETGDFLWAFQMGDTSFNRGSSIFLDNQRNIHTTGRFSGTTDANPDTGVFLLTAPKFTNMFIQKLSQGPPILGVDSIVSFSPTIEYTSGIRVYPNPSNGLFNISFNAKVENAELTLTDLNGRIMAVHRVKNTDNSSIQIDEAPGIYFLHIQTPEGNFHLPLVKR